MGNVVHISQNRSINIEASHATHPSLGLAVITMYRGTNDDLLSSGLITPDMVPVGRKRSTHKTMHGGRRLYHFRKRAKDVCELRVIDYSSFAEYKEQLPSVDEVENAVSIEAHVRRKFDLLTDRAFAHWRTNARRAAVNETLRRMESEISATHEHFNAMLSTLQRLESSNVNLNAVWAAFHVSRESMEDMYRELGGDPPWGPIESDDAEGPEC